MIVGCVLFLVFLAALGLTQNSSTSLPQKRSCRLKEGHKDEDIKII